MPDSSGMPIHLFSVFGRQVPSSVLKEKDLEKHLASFLGNLMLGKYANSMSKEGVLFVEDLDLPVEELQELFGLKKIEAYRLSKAVKQYTSLIQC